ncbi:MAG: hypothetical protein WCR04_12340 [Fibrobacteraceae bacterium]
MKMKMKRNYFTLMEGLFILLLIAFAGGGYAWYRCDKANRIREEKASRVASAEHKIVVFQDEIKAKKTELNLALEELKKCNSELDAIDASLKSSQAGFSAASQALSDVRSGLRRAQIAMKKKTNLNQIPNFGLIPPADTETSRTRLALKKMEGELKFLEKERQKIECQYVCLKYVKPKIRKQSDSDGSGELTEKYWYCEKHKFTFTSRISYLDYKSLAGQLDFQIAQCRRLLFLQKEQMRIAEKNEISPADELPAASQSTFDAAEWNRRLEGQSREVTGLRDEIMKTEKSKWDTLNRRSSLVARTNELIAQIKTYEGGIVDQKLVIAENRE